MANFNKRLLSCLYLPLIDFICRIRIRYPFRAESPRKGHYRESPGIGTHKHTRHSYLNSSISQCKNKKNKKKTVLTQYRGAPRSSLIGISRHLVAHFATNVLQLPRQRNACVSSSVLLLKSYKALCRSIFFTLKKINFLTKIYFCKKAAFLCKKATFFTKYIFVKTQLFYIKKPLSYKNIFCKKTDFLHKKQLFYKNIFL